MASVNGLPLFERLQHRYVIQGQVAAQSALRIGAGKSQDISASDQPIMRDGQGAPFLPGSSLKGALRAGLERLLRGLDHPALRACDPFDKDAACSGRLHALTQSRAGQSGAAEVSQAELTEYLCAVCALFGCSYLAGRLFARDLPLVQPVRVEVRDGVGINRDLRTAQDKVKYDHEALPPGTRFKLELRVENPSAVHLALTLKALELLNEGEILLGGLTSRGLGRVTLDNVRLQVTDARRLTTGAGWEALDYRGQQALAGRTLADLLAGKQD